MTQPAFVSPIIGCFLLSALAGCETTKSEAPSPAQVATETQPERDRPQANPPVPRQTFIDAGDRVFFAYDSSLLSSDSARVLQAQAAWLKAASDKGLTVEGHADERGTREYNLALGDRRASAVRDYLIAQGVAPQRIHTVSYGKERPIVLGNNESAWSQNRCGISVPQ
jgi:peptidoglycan-associated lipoprotein